ncbi:PREDICTED: A-kinase anchor protein 5 [Condylura cristata]|uniref:A-kinase anchor protein 5 n=1 Tax=Condylura cristata TaxID=143302 RepID=UPI00064290EE|nr:PREDICTED: A-kinase anchor protein 5 [Condylura cristata]
MKESTVKMETTASEIQVESKDEKKVTEVSPQDKKQEKKASMLCFKRRKKAAKAVKPKADSKAADAARKHTPEAGASDQLQPPGGAWASIKRLVTRKKRSDSKQQQSLEANVQPEINAEDTDLSKKKAKSRLKIPCIKFSKGEKRSDHSKIIEDSDYSIKVQGEAESLDTKPPTQLADQATNTNLTQPVNEVSVSQKVDDEVCESNVSNSVTGENVISVELGIDTVPSAIQTETVVLEEEIKTIEETQSVQPQQASPPEISEAEHQPPVASDVLPSPEVPDQPIEKEERSSLPESGLNCEDHESREIVGEESKPKDTELSQETDFKENEINAEKPNLEESKRMEPIAIIITDTEISEFDVKKSKNVPKQFLISIENEQVGVFANDSGFEGRTSEQYETLLIETASSLVKNAIQLSIEQLVNEMVSDDNKINNLLQ